MNNLLKKTLFALWPIALTACAESPSDGEWPIPEEPICEMNYTPEATDFALWAPTAEEVEVRIYAGEACEQILPMTPAEACMWRTRIEGDQHGKSYTFRVKVDGTWLAESAGIFARAVTANGLRGVILDLATTNPDGWDADCSPVLTAANQIAVYEMHYRDMTAHPSAGSRYPGKYLGMAERGTRSQEGLPTGLDHLVELGVSHVHLLPTADFGSIDETIPHNDQYNWGYEPQHFNTPEGTYSTDASEPAARIRELKTLVQAMHRAGLRVVLDVVYNHTTWAERCGFELTVPGYFYRMLPDGSFANGSGCGNETASERAMMRKFMVESLEYWVREYHIDGFRFDLMAIHDIETMNLIRERLSAIDPTILLYGEGWAAMNPAYEESQLAFKRYTHRMPGVAAFSDDLRNALRGNLECTVGGFIHGIEGNQEGVKFGLVGGIAHPEVHHYEAPWCGEPTQHMSYVTCHDDHNLRDRLEHLSPEASEQERLQMAKLAQTAVFTSQGLPFIFCGEELYRTKLGEKNTYNLPDKYNAIDWSNKARYRSFYDYHRGLIALRKAHPAFCLGRADRVRNHLEFLPTENTAAVGFRLKELDGLDSAREIVVLLNGSRKEASFALPTAGRWRIVADGKQVVPEGIGTLQTTANEVIQVKPIEALILILD
ncbi:MAG: type I pullulanase [Alistipes sp.]|nr:type I pullulanase [Alistipes sp.]